MHYRFRLSELRMCDWLSYRGNHQHDFQTGLTTIYGRNEDRPGKDSNASGKTGLTHAIDYAIRGTLEVDFSVADLAHRGSEGYELRLRLLDLNSMETLTIFRARQKRKVEFWWSFLGQKVQGDPNETQKKLDELLGLTTSDVYSSIVYLSPSPKRPSLRARSSTSRIEMLSALIDTGPLDYAHQQVSSKLSELTKLRDQFLTKSTTYRDLLKRTGEELAEIQRLEIAAREENKRAHRATTVVTKELELKILQLQTELRDLPQHDLTKLQAESGQIQTTLAGYVQTQAQLNLLLQTAEPGVGVCPKCMQEVGADHVAHLKQDRARAQAALEEMYASLAPLRARQEELVKLIEEARARPYRERAIKAQIDQYHAQIYAAREKIEDQAIHVNAAKAKDAMARMDSHRQMVLEADSEVMNLNKHIPILSTLKDGFGKEIRNMLLEELRVDLDHYTRLYVQYICPELHIEHKTSKASGKECWDLVIKRDEDPNRLVSGAEGLALDLALSLALRQSLLNLNSCSLDFIILDDFFGRVDNAGCHDVANLLRGLTETGVVSNILVTVPREMGLTETNSITITKRRGKSRIGP